jgi:hypothetical protein
MPMFLEWPWIPGQACGLPGMTRSKQTEFVSLRRQNAGVEPHATLQPGGEPLAVRRH